MAIGRKRAAGLDPGFFSELRDCEAMSRVEKTACRSWPRGDCMTAHCGSDVTAVLRSPTAQEIRDSWRATRGQEGVAQRKCEIPKSRTANQAAAPGINLPTLSWMLPFLGIQAPYSIRMEGQMTKSLTAFCMRDAVPSPRLEGAGTCTTLKILATISVWAAIHVLIVAMSRACRCGGSNWSTERDHTSSKERVVRERRTRTG